MFKLSTNLKLLSMKNTIRIISLLLIILISSCSEEDINENYEPSSDNFSSTSQDSKKTPFILGEKKVKKYQYTDMMQIITAGVIFY